MEEIKPKKKRTKKIYFGVETDKSILKYQKSTDRAEREELCRNSILPAFRKLSSYWYHRLAVIKNEETIHDCVAYLFEKINMFDGEKKTNGFSYFNMVARHWYFQKLRLEKKEISQDSPHLTININDPTILFNDKLILDSVEDDMEKKEFVKLLKEMLPKWKERASKDQEKKVLDALIVLFENVDNFDNYKKKAIIFYLREITGLKPKQIVLNLTKIKKKYLRFKENYLKGDV